MGAVTRIIIFVSIVTLVYVGLHYFLAIWTTRHFNLPFSGKTIRIFFVIMALCFPLSAILVRKDPNLFTYGFNILCYAWMGIIFIWFCFAFAETLLEIIFLITKISYSKKIAGFVVGFSVLTFGLYAFTNAIKQPQIKKIEISLANLPQNLDGFSIAVLSDTHLCHLVPFKNFSRLIVKLKKLNPDILVHLGDFVETDSLYAEKIYTLMQTITPKYGKFAIFGNHEFYSGLKKSKEIYEKSGFKLLRQETITLPTDLQITGIDDIHTASINEKDIKNIFTNIDTKKTSIVLSHQPLHYNLLAELKTNLVLSGHTHAGQIFPFNYFVKMRYPYLYGLIKKSNTFFYITSGAFYWGPPMRLFTANEVPILILKTKN
jgi:predicted MPP superfamily phosphohydrolase